VLGILRKRKRDRAFKALAEADIPSLPVVAFKVLEKIRDPDASARDIASLIELDIGISTRLLRTANSAAFGLRNPARDPAQALSMLGARRVEQLVLALAVGDALPAKETRGFRATRFWSAAARRAAVARALAQVLCPAEAPSTFTAALLQDMAVPLLAHSGPPVYGDLLADWQHGDSHGLDELEQAEFGWDHADVGAFVGERWKFPDCLVGGIGDHHGEPNEPPDAATAARLVAPLREEPCANATEVLGETVRSRYGLPADRVVQAIEEGTEQAGELALLFAAR